MYLTAGSYAYEENEALEEKRKSPPFPCLQRQHSNVIYSNHFSSGFPMLSQISALPPLSESAMEVSNVRPASQFHQIVIECRMVLC